MTRVSNDSFIVKFAPNPACNPALSGSNTCCNTDANQVEFVIQEQCQGAIDTITSTGPSAPMQPSYQNQPWPGTPPAGMSGSPLCAKVTGLTTSGQDTDFTVTLKAGSACPTVESFLYKSASGSNAFWFAAFGDTYKLDSCCGTGSL
jgi:hypothetical protein